MIRKDKVVDMLGRCILMCMTSGISYEEGKVLFSAGASVMEQIDKTPDASEEVLGELVEAVIEGKL